MWVKRGAIAALFSITAVILAACGGGGASTPESSKPTNTPPTLTVTLTDPTSNAAVTAITPSKPGKVTATLKSGSGSPIAGAVVTFSTTANIGTFVPDSAAGVTDSSGSASVLLYPSLQSGTAQVQASVTINQSGSSQSSAVTGTVAFSATAAPAISVGLFDPSSGTPRNSISSGNPARVSATLKQTTGAPAVGVVVTFTTAATTGTFTPTSGTALTDSTGVASVLLNAPNLTSAGAGIVTATGQVTTGTTTNAVTGTASYSLGATNISLSPVSIATPTLSAYGTTSISVIVSAGGVASTTPFTVNFTSPCASNGRATLTSSVQTVNGVATASYRDNACAGSDIITATIPGLTATSQGTITVSPPAVGSIQFVSATPASISLRGTGGLGRQETSQISFRVVDVAGNPLGGRTVNFSLNTSVGGITLSSTSAPSDPTSGLAVTNVQAGTISTPVRVTATTINGTDTLSTQSDTLSITTGIPAQDSFSLSATILNIEGLDNDGITTQLTIRVADHFRNPVPDGTAVNFTAEGASVVGSCVTRDGACSVTLTSQAFKPSNGRITVLAYAVGEEAFVDLNGNGWFDILPISELRDPDGRSGDLPEAFVDFNENGIRDANEPFIDFNNNGIYDGPDGKFSGVLCDETVAGRSAPGSCASSKTINVRDSTVIVLSGAAPFFRTNPNDTAATAPPSSNGIVFPASISLPTCSTAADFTPSSVTRDYVITDVNGNALPAGTTITFTTTNGVIANAPTAGSPLVYTVANTNSCAFPGTGGCPPSVPPTRDISRISGAGLFSVVVASDATQTRTLAGMPPVLTRTCTNTSASGFMNISVKTPRGVTTNFSVSVTD
jgi:hypothetical protein